MKTEFQGKYFNGVVSKPFQCNVRFDRRTIVIQTLDESGQTIETINWDIEQVIKQNIEVGNKFRIKYGNYPFQVLEIVDKMIVSSFVQNYPQFSFGKKRLLSFLSKGWVILFGILLGVVLFGFILFKSIIPGIAEYAATKVPLSMEQSIGDAAYNQTAMSLTEDTVKSALLKEFFDEMNLESKYDYTLSVLTSETVNAFAVPGGRIAVYSGILDEIDTPEALAALLAHESSHIELQHSLKSIFRSLSGYLTVSLFLGDMGGISAIVFENINVFHGLQYSRTMEKEADTRGLKEMQKSGIDPQGMIELFHTISSNEENQDSEDPDNTDKLSEFMSTHPLTKHRISYIQKYVDEDKHQYKDNVKLDSLFVLIKRK